jgi:hypothetical protein
VEVEGGDGGALGVFRVGGAVGACERKCEIERREHNNQNSTGFSFIS